MPSPSASSRASRLLPTNSPLIFDAFQRDDTNSHSLQPQAPPNYSRRQNQDLISRRFSYSRSAGNNADLKLQDSTGGIRKMKSRRNSNRGNNAHYWDRMDASPTMSPLSLSFIHANSLDTENSLRNDHRYPPSTTTTSEVASNGISIRMTPRGEDDNHGIRRKRRRRSESMKGRNSSPATAEMERICPQKDESRHDYRNQISDTSSSQHEKSHEGLTLSVPQITQSKRVSSRRFSQSQTRSAPSSALAILTGHIKPMSARDSSSASKKKHSREVRTPHSARPRSKSSARRSNRTKSARTSSSRTRDQHRRTRRRKRMPSLHENSTSSYMQVQVKRKKSASDSNSRKSSVTTPKHSSPTLRKRNNSLSSPSSEFVNHPKKVSSPSLSSQVHFEHSPMRPLLVRNSFEYESQDDSLHPRDGYSPLSSIESSSMVGCSPPRSISGDISSRLEDTGISDIHDSHDYSFELPKRKRRSSFHSSRGHASSSRKRKHNFIDPMQRFEQPDLIKRPQSARTPRKRYPANLLVESLQKINSQRQEMPLMEFDHSQHSVKPVYGNHERRAPLHTGGKNSDSSNNGEALKKLRKSSARPHSSASVNKNVSSTFPSVQSIENSIHEPSSSPSPGQAVPVLNLGVLNVSQKSLSARPQTPSGRIHSARGSRVAPESARVDHGSSLTRHISSAQLKRPSHSARPKSSLPENIHYIPFTEIVSTEHIRERTPSPAPSTSQTTRTEEEKIGVHPQMFFYHLLTEQEWRKVFSFLDGPILYRCSLLCKLFHYSIFNIEFFSERLRLRKREHTFYMLSRKGRTSDVSLNELSNLQAGLCKLNPSDFAFVGTECIRDPNSGQNSARGNANIPTLTTEQKNILKYTCFVLYDHRVHRIELHHLRKYLKREEFMEMILDYDVSEMTENMHEELEHFVYHMKSGSGEWRTVRTPTNVFGSNKGTSKTAKLVRRLLETLFHWLDVQCQLFKCEKSLLLENRISAIQEWIRENYGSEVYSTAGDGGARRLSMPLVVEDE